MQQIDVAHRIASIAAHIGDAIRSAAMWIRHHRAQGDAERAALFDPMHLFLLGDAIHNLHQLTTGDARHVAAALAWHRRIITNLCAALGSERLAILHLDVGQLQADIDAIAAQLQPPTTARHGDTEILQACTGSAR